MSDVVKVEIDGREVQVPKGQNLIEAAKSVGVDIPHFCYHSHLSVAGNCRMCMVEVEGARGLPIACNTGCTEGMKVRTATDAVKEARAAVMEFLLVNHPIDCPVCDQAGECKLQVYYMEHDRRDSVVEVEEKVKKGKAIEVGPRVMLDQERCVACSRCVRFCDEVTGTGELRLMNRGDHTTIDTWPDRKLDNDYSVNTVDICPVGALTSRDFRFQARAWYLKHDDTICPGCATGCNVSLSHYRQVELSDYNGMAYRLRPRINDAVNKAWMCDSGRKEYARVNERRVERPIAHGVEIGWDGVGANLEKAIGALRDRPGSVAGIVGFDSTNEEIWAFRALLAEAFGEKEVALVACRPDGRGDDLLMDADKHPNRRGAELVLGPTRARDVARYLAGRQAVFVLDADPAHEGAEAGVREAFAAVPKKIVIAANLSATTASATIVLPAASYAEKDGTWVNRQGRVQRIRRVLRKRFDARPPLAILARLATALSVAWPAERGDASSLFDCMAQSMSEFDGLDYFGIGKLGAPLSAAQRAGVGGGRA